MEKIRAKQASKPKAAALPGTASLECPPNDYATGFRQGYEEASTNAEIHGHPDPDERSQSATS